MLPHPPPLGAGLTVAHPSFACLRLPAHAVVVEVWPAARAPAGLAELDNGLLLPLAALTIIDTGERWRPVEGYESYLVSSHGKVVNTQYRRTSRQRLMRVQKPTVYPFIYVTNKGGKKQVGINRLVAQAFLPAPAGHLTMVIPLDSNRLNVRADNLRWVDPHERHDISVVGYLHCCGARHRLSKLTAATIALVQQQVATGRSHQAIADALGVSRPNISLIIAGKAWRLAQWLPGADPDATALP